MHASKKTLLALGITAAVISQSVLAAVGAPEKEELKLGFIKLTDMAPLAVAYEKGFFEEEAGLFGPAPLQKSGKTLG